MKKKHNWLKYVFVVFAIALISYAVYYIRKQEKEENVEENIESNVEEKQVTTITTLRVSAVNVDTMNPILSNNQNIQDISKLIYEPMLTITEDYKIEKCLAKEWINLSDTAYVIVLKEGVKWQNGEEITATDVKYTIEQIQNIGGNSIYYENVKNIVNVEILSTYNIKITIDKKIPFFEYNLTFPIMSAKYYDNGDMASSDKNNNAPGTGMYSIGNITSTEIELKKNENWWGIKEKGDLSLQTILIKNYSSIGEAYNAFKLGNLDLITTQSNNYEDYIGTLGYSTAEYVGRKYDYLVLNCNSAPLNNLELRKAINCAIDKSNIIAQVYGNKYYVADFPLSTSNYLYNVEKVSSSFNSNKSKELLENAGWEFKSGIWTKNSNRTKLNLVINEGNEDRIKVAETIKKQLDDIGININIMKVKDSQFNRYIENKNYDMILTGKLIGLSPDLTSYVGEGNLSNFDNTEIKNTLEQIADLSDNETELKTKYSRIVKLIDDECPFISLYFNKNTVIYRQDLQGKVSPNFYNIFYNVEKWVRQY